MTNMPQSLSDNAKHKSHLNVFTGTSTSVLLLVIEYPHNLRRAKRLRQYLPQMI